MKARFGSAHGGDTGPSRVLFFVILAIAWVIFVYLAAAPRPPVPPILGPAPAPPEKPGLSKAAVVEPPFRMFVGPRCTAALRPGDPKAMSARVEIARLENDDVFAVQLSTSIGPVAASDAIIVSFEARADPPRTVLITATTVLAPWTNIGLHETISADPDWRRHKLQLTSTADVSSAAVFFNLGGSLSTFEIRSLSIERKPSPQ